MSQLELTQTGIRQGVWQGLLTGAGPTAPGISVTHLQKPVPDVSLAPADAQGEWIVRIPIPLSAISEGVQTFLVSEDGTGDRLASFSVIAGEVLGDDLRAEINLLREELDLLKRAFRRHCVETA